MFILIVGLAESARPSRSERSTPGTRSPSSTPTRCRTSDWTRTSRRRWEDAGGRFTVGTALEIDGLMEAGIEDADVFLAATRGDNTNLVIAQIAQRRFNVARRRPRRRPGPRGLVRRAGTPDDLPTQLAIDQAEQVVLAPLKGVRTRCT